MHAKLLIILFIIILFSISAFASISDEVYRVVSSEGEKVGVVFIDLKSGQEFQFNGQKQFPAASVAKVPVMVAVYNLVESGKINLGQQIILKDSDKLGGSGVLQWIKAGRVYTLRNLIRCMISLSDNTATKMLIDNIGLENINNYINSISLKNTKVTDPTMLKEPPDPGINITTPQDIAQLLSRIYNEYGFSSASIKEMLAFMKNQRYRWGICRGVPSGTIVANKTGNLEGILNDAGIVYAKNGNYILSIFTYGYKKQRQARELINKISQVVYENYTGTKVIYPKKIFKRKSIRKFRKRYLRYRRHHRRY